MRTIEFNNSDIKDCKLALANQNLTSLQSAFLMQHITNLENANEIKQQIINKAREYINKNIKDDYYCRKSDYLINNLLEILGENNE